MSRKDAILSLRQVLIHRRDALRRVLAGDLSLLKDLRAHTHTRGDDAEQAAESAQEDISSRLAEVESRELTRIEYALERMRIGVFGVCESCGASIPMARLNALPYATCCIDCQRKMERQGTSASADSSDGDWRRLARQSEESGPPEPNVGTDTRHTSF